jgi:1,4-alpha-glucan branching enzyme
MRMNQNALSGWGAAMLIIGIAEATAVDTSPSADREPGVVDNHALLPRFRPDAEVTWQGTSPDWLPSLIMAEFRIETATPAGTFAAATQVLDHYAEMGVNGLWIDPIWERGAADNGYGNWGPRLVEPRLTGGVDTNLAAAAGFVTAAHQRNLRVVFDIIVWGTRTDAPLVKEHPEFYRRNVDGSMYQCWGGYGFDWAKAAFRPWFKAAAVDFILKTGADGLRVDLAPDMSGYFFRQVREELRAAGRKVLIISELPEQRRDAFDFEQTGVTGWSEVPAWGDAPKLAAQQREFGRAGEYFLNHDIVEMIRSGRGIGSAERQQAGKGGEFRFYTSLLLCHDDDTPQAGGNRVRFAYGTIFAPFIPLWWIGEEWNNPKVIPAGASGAVMYFNRIDWSQLEVPTNRAFYEDVKRYIRIRRQFPRLFEYFPDNHRTANIAPVSTRVEGAPNRLAAYGRFRDRQAILVVPNYGYAKTETIEVLPNFDALQLGPAPRYKLTDLLTSREIGAGSAAELGRFTVTVAAEQLGVYLLERSPE